METIFVLTTHVVVDFEDLDINNQLFFNMDDAIQALKEWKEDEIKYAKENEWEIACDYDTHFEAYQDGCYCQNHSIGFIREEQVK